MGEQRKVGVINIEQAAEGDTGILYHKGNDLSEHKRWLRIPQAEGMYGLNKIREVWPCGEDKAQKWVMLHEQDTQ